VKTTADFYIGYEWLGSIYGGHPTEVGGDILVRTRSAVDYRRRVIAFLLANPKASSLLDEGWPWPWLTSHETEYVYRFHQEDKVWVHKKGSGFWKCGRKKIADDCGWFPCMADVQNVGITSRSGMILVAGEV